MRILNTTYEPVPPSDPMTTEEIVDLCCKEVPFDPCAKVGRVSPYTGAERQDWDFDPEEELKKAQDNEEWKNSGRRVVSVSTEAVGGPRPGQPCGEKKETWTGRNNCCDFVEPMAWDTDVSAEVVAPGSRVIVGVTGGAPPYHWSVRGEGFSLDGYNLRDGWTDTPYTWVYAHDFACGFAPIEVSDGCSTVIDGIRATVGKWTKLGEIIPHNLIDYAAYGFVGFNVGGTINGPIPGSGDVYSKQYCLCAGTPGADVQWWWSVNTLWHACSPMPDISVPDQIVGAFAVPVTVGIYGTQAAPECGWGSMYIHQWNYLILSIYRWSC